MAAADGMHLDVSPEEGPADFIEVESKTTLLRPDRPSNNPLDEMMNILAHPQVALLFMIAPVAESLQVNDSADILDDPKTCDRFSNQRSLASECDADHHRGGFHPLRQGSLKGQTVETRDIPSERPVATLGEMIRDHAEMDVPDTSQDAVDKLYRDTLH